MLFTVTILLFVEFGAKEYSKIFTGMGRSFISLGVFGSKVSISPPKAELTAKLVARSKWGG